MFLCVAFHCSKMPYQCNTGLGKASGLHGGNNITLVCRTVFGEVLVPHYLPFFEIIRLFFKSFGNFRWYLDYTWMILM
jgi:hypothetical protein